MVAYTARLQLDRVDPVAIGRYWSDRVEDLFRACVADRHLLAPQRTVDVRFDDFMADDMGTVARIYDVAGQPLTDPARSAMAAFVAAHPRGRHGTVVYDASVLGIDEAERRRSLAFYSERFGVAETGA
jgi:hypothetical protein